jgi:hypothetical protein
MVMPTGKLGIPFVPSMGRVGSLALYHTPALDQSIVRSGGSIAELWLTFTVRLALSEAEPLLAVRVTAYGPVAEKEWLGFWDVLVEPAPKFHCQAVGLPVDVSVNCTACPATGEAGLNVKDATSSLIGFSASTAQLEQVAKTKITKSTYPYI